MANTTGLKYGGRQKGAPNRLTKELRAILKEALHKELESIGERLEQLEPKERLEVLIKFVSSALFIESLFGKKFISLSD